MFALAIREVVIKELIKNEIVHFGTTVTGSKHER